MLSGKRLLQRVNQVGLVQFSMVLNQEHNRLLAWAYTAKFSMLRLILFSGLHSRISGCTFAISVSTFTLTAKWQIKYQPHADSVQNLFETVGRHLLGQQGTIKSISVGISGNYKPQHEKPQNFHLLVLKQCLEFPRLLQETWQRYGLEICTLLSTFTMKLCFVYNNTQFV